MTKFEELQARKIKTVGELIEKLKEIPADTGIISTDIDIGGYDVSHANYVMLTFGWTMIKS